MNLPSLSLNALLHPVVLEVQNFNPTVERGTKLGLDAGKKGSWTINDTHYSAQTIAGVRLLISYYQNQHASQTGTLALYSHYGVVVQVPKPLPRYTEDVLRIRFPNSLAKTFRAFREEMQEAHSANAEFVNYKLKMPEADMQALYESVASVGARGGSYASALVSSKAQQELQEASEWLDRVETASRKALVANLITFAKIRLADFAAKLASNVRLQRL